MYSIILFSSHTLTLFYLLLCIIFPFLLVKTFISKTEEDLYHSTRNKKDGGKIIAKIIKKNFSIEEIEKKLKLFIDVYNKNNSNTIPSHDSNYVFTNIDTYNKLDEDNNYHYRILINPNDNTIHFDFTHKYIGGAYLRDLTLSFLNTKQVSNEKFYPHSSFVNIYFFFKLLYNYNTIPKINGVVLKLVNSKSNMQRYMNTYNIDRVLDNIYNNKYSSRIIIIFNALKKIQQSLNIGRQLVCYLPVRLWWNSFFIFIVL
jgi:hypothetical protein